MSLAAYSLFPHLVIKYCRSLETGRDDEESKINIPEEKSKDLIRISPANAIVAFICIQYLSNKLVVFVESHTDCHALTRIIDRLTSSKHHDGCTEGGHYARAHE